MFRKGKQTYFGQRFILAYGFQIISNQFSFWHKKLHCLLCRQNSTLRSYQHAFQCMLIYSFTTGCRYKNVSCFPMGECGGEGVSPPTTSRSSQGGGGGGKCKSSWSLASPWLSWRAVRATEPACRLAISSVEGFELRFGTLGFGLGLGAGGGARVNCAGPRFAGWPPVSDTGEKLPSAIPHVSTGERGSTLWLLRSQHALFITGRGNDAVRVVSPDLTVFGLDRWSFRLRERSREPDGDVIGEVGRLNELRLNDDKCVSSGMTSGGGLWTWWRNRILLWTPSSLVDVGRCPRVGFDGCVGVERAKKGEGRLSHPGGALESRGKLWGAVRDSGEWPSTPSSSITWT
jgi:hypothetical protein